MKRRQIKKKENRRKIMEITGNIAEDECKNEMVEEIHYVFTTISLSADENKSEIEKKIATIIGRKKQISGYTVKNI